MVRSKWVLPHWLLPFCVVQAAVLLISPFAAMADGARGLEGEMVIQIGRPTGRLIAFSPDGRYILNSEGNNTVALWRSDGLLVRTIETTLVRITGIEFTAEGEAFVCAGQTGAGFDGDGFLSDARSVALRNLEGRLIRYLEGRLSSVVSLDVSPDGLIGCAGTGEGGAFIELWTPEGRLVRSFPVDLHWEGNIAMGSRELLGVVENDDEAPNYGSASRLMFYDRDGRARFGIVSQEHAAFFGSLAVSPCERWFAYGAAAADAAAPPALVLWDRQGGKIVLERDATNLNALAFGPDGRLYAAFMQELEEKKGIHTVIRQTGVIKIWDSGGKLLNTVENPEGHSQALALSTDGRLASASTSGIRIYSPDGDLLRDFGNRASRILDVAVSSDGRIAAKDSISGTVGLWTTEGGYLGTLQSPHRSMRLRFLEDGSLIDLHTGGYHLWDREGELVRVFDQPEWRSLCMDVNAKGVVARGSMLGEIELLDLDGVILEALGDFEDAVEGLRFSGNGRYLLAFDAQGSAKLYGSDGEFVYGLRDRLDAGAFTIDVSPDGSHLIHREGSGICVRDADGARRLIALPHDARYPLDPRLAIHPDGSCFVSGAGDGLLKLWDLEGHCLRSVEAPKVMVGALTFSPDGRYVVCGFFDGSARLWNTETWESVALLSDGEEWIVYSDDGYFDSYPDGGELVTMTRGLTVNRIDQFALKRNRPDVLLKRLGSGSEELRRHYFLRYLNRLAKLDVLPQSIMGETFESEILHGAEPEERELLLSTYRRKADAYVLRREPGLEARLRLYDVPSFLSYVEGLLQTDLHVPEAKILSAEQEGKRVELHLCFSDSRLPLAAYNVYMNDVPVYAGLGMPIDGRSILVDEAVELTSGHNKIEASCYNAGLSESYRDVVHFDYEEPVLGDLYFIGFGVSDYRDPELDLLYPAKDVQDIAELFGRMKDSYRRVHVYTYTDRQCTVRNIGNVQGKLRGAAVDDTVVLFISGHGMYTRDENAEYYFLTHDADVDDLAQTAAPFELVEGILAGIAPRRKLLLMDTCESGELDAESILGSAAVIGEGEIRARTVKGLGVHAQAACKSPTRAYLHEKDRYIYNDLFRRTGAVVFSSSRGGELSYEPGEYRDEENGFFTRAVWESLMGPGADVDADGRVSTTEMRTWVSRSVSERTQGLQNPTVDRDNIYQELSFPYATSDLRQSDPRNLEAYLVRLSESGRTERVRDFLAQDLRLSGEAHEAALRAAAAAGHPPVVALLLESGVDPNGRSSLGLSAAKMAYDAGHYDVVDSLLRAGADVPAEYLLKSRQDGRFEAVERFLQAGSGIEELQRDDALLDAVVLGFPQVARVLVEGGADPNVRGAYRSTALNEAISRGFLDLAELLIQHGADVNRTDARGRTPLQTAVEERNANLARHLIELGAEVEESGGWLLHIAVGDNSADLVRLLLEAGVGTELRREPDQETPLMRAADRGYENIVRLLVGAGADLAAENADGRTALDMARDRGHAAVVDYLESLPAPR